jgi:flagellar FliL protein
MAVAKADTTKTAPEAAPDKGGHAAAGASGGGISSWLPLLANIVLMPVLAYATFNFLILPKMKGTTAAAVSASAESHGKEKEKSTGHDGKPVGQVTVPLGGKVLVNVAGTMGTRYLLAQVTLVSSNPDLKALEEKHDAALRDSAASALSSKTIADLEKPGARNLIRSELISVFNNILGDNIISDIYLTEFAIQ